MSTIYPLLSNITTGELSPREKGDTASAVYRGGLDFCENFEITPNGSIEMRSGTSFVSQIPENDAVLKRFERDVNNDAVVCIGTEKIRVYTVDGQSIGGINLLDDPKFNNTFDNDWFRNDQFWRC